MASPEFEPETLSVLDGRDNHRNHEILTTNTFNLVLFYYFHSYINLCFLTYQLSRPSRPLAVAQ